MLSTIIQFGDLKAHLIGLFFLAIITFFKSELKINKFDFWYIGFLIVFLISSFFSLTPYGFKEFSTFFGGFIIYLLAKNSLISFKKYKISLYLILAIICGLSINYFLYSPLDRLEGIFIGYPNVMATFLLLLLPIVIYDFFRYSFQEDRFEKIITLIVLIFSSIAFILTFSRGALLASFIILSLGLGVYAVIQKNLKLAAKKIMYACFLLFAISVITFFIQESKLYSLDIINRTTLQDVSSAKSVNERLIFFKNSFAISTDNIKNFTFGIGPGSFGLVHPAWQDFSFVNSEHPHNIFIKIFVENGIFAFTFFTFWICLIAINYLKSFILNFKNQIKTIPIALGVLAFFIASMVDYNLGFVPIYLILFGYIGYLTKYFNCIQITINNKSIKIFSSLILILVLIQGFYFYQIETNPNNKPYFFEFIPFKQDIDTLTKNLDVLNYININYPNLHTANFALAMQTDNNEQKKLLLTKAITQNPYNNFEYYLELFKLKDPTIEQLEFLAELLENYNYLLSINAHFTVLKNDTMHANELYKIIINKLQDNKKRSEIIKLYQEFKIILFQEAIKFDTRYKTNLFNKVSEWNYNY